MNDTDTRPPRRGGHSKIEKPNPVDVHVGSRVRLRRVLLGMSQETLAAALGLTFQQVQKYERGVNRISASRLWAIGQVLDAPISFFFDGINAPACGNAGQISVERLLDRDAAQLLNAFNGVENLKVRRAITTLLATLADTDDL